MNEAAINKAGVKPVMPYLSRIEKIKNVSDVQKVIAALHDAGLPAVFGFGAGPDLKNSNNVIANAGQGGLTLPNRDYYTAEDAKSVACSGRKLENISSMDGHQLHRSGTFETVCR